MEGMPFSEAKELFRQDRPHEQEVYHGPVPADTIVHRRAAEVCEDMNIVRKKFAASFIVFEIPLEK